jgi:hypothetical protein
MATSVTSVFTIDDHPTGPDGQPLRRSERLHATRSGHEVIEEKQTVQGIDYTRRSLKNVKKQKTWKLYAVRAINVNLDNLWPGRIVKAIDCYPQTNLIAKPYDRIIGATGLAGPIEAKFRYMVSDEGTDSTSQRSSDGVWT